MKNKEICQSCGHEMEPTGELTIKGVVYPTHTCPNCGYYKTWSVKNTGHEIYDEGHYNVKPYKGLPFLIKAFDNLLIYTGIKRAVNGKPKNLLDFGCGKGLFLYFMSKVCKWRLYGVEVSEARSEFAKNLGVAEIMKVFYSEGQLADEKFDAITLFHVLEHLEQYQGLMKNLVSANLSDNGTLVIEVPNYNSVQRKLSGKYWAHFTPWFHVNHFNEKSLKCLMAELGLKVKMKTTYSLYHGSMGMVSALMIALGYRSSLYEDVKKLKLHIVLFYLLLLPIALVFELICSLFGRGGIIRVYGVKDKAAKK